MGFRADKVDRRSSIRSRACSFWPIHIVGTAAADHYAATSVVGLAVGASLTGFAAFFARAPQSLFFTTATGTGNITLRIVGEDQFGDSVSEDLALVGVTTAQTLYCYRRCTSITVVANTTGAGMTVSVGTSLVSVRVPMLAKQCPAAAILAVRTVTTSVAAQTLTIDSQRSTILLSGTSTVGPANVILDPQFAAYL